MMFGTHTVSEWTALLAETVRLEALRPSKRPRVPTQLSPIMLVGGNVVPTPTPATTPFPAAVKPYVSLLPGPIVVKMAGGARTQYVPAVHDRYRRELEAMLNSGRARHIRDNVYETT